MYIYTFIDYHVFVYTYRCVYIYMYYRLSTVTQGFRAWGSQLEGWGLGFLKVGAFLCREGAKASCRIGCTILRISVTSSKSKLFIEPCHVTDGKPLRALSFDLHALCPSRVLGLEACTSVIQSRLF